MTTAFFIVGMGLGLMRVGDKLLLILLYPLWLGCEGEGSEFALRAFNICPLFVDLRFTPGNREAVRPLV